MKKHDTRYNNSQERVNKSSIDDIDDILSNHDMNLVERRHLIEGDEGIEGDEEYFDEVEGYPLGVSLLLGFLRDPEIRSVEIIKPERIFQFMNEEIVGIRVNKNAIYINTTKNKCLISLENISDVCAWKHVPLASKLQRLMALLKGFCKRKPRINS